MSKISDYVENDEEIYAHIQNEKNPETLCQHSDLAFEYAMKIIKAQNLEPLINNIGLYFFKEENVYFDLWKNMFFDTIYLHDLGKCNVNFQALKMNNRKFSSTNNKNSKHSEISAKIYFDIYSKKLKEIPKEDTEYKKLLRHFMYINMYLITRHHGYLNSFGDYISKFLEKDDESYINIEKFFDDFENAFPNICVEQNTRSNSLAKWLINENTFLLNLEDKKDERSNFTYYIYAKLLYSLLVSADFYSTAEYMSGIQTEDFGTVIDIEKFYKPYKNTKIYNAIQNYAKNRKSDGVFQDINEARSEMFIEAEENLLKNSDKNLFYLEAPTGSGKTNTAINLSLKIIELSKNINKIFYVFPFNTLVEQTKDTLLKSFQEDKEITVGNEIGVINSITPIFDDKTEDNNDIKIVNSNNKLCISERIDYTRVLLGHQFLHYPIILTTHVKLFDWLFGLGRESHFPLCQLANSVVILDEIQSYKNSIWKEIANSLKYFAEILNIKFIIMSATLPKIGLLISRESSEGTVISQSDSVDNRDIFEPLIKDRNKYFMCEFFKDRVLVDFSLINDLKDISDEDKKALLAKKIMEQYLLGKDVLVEFIKKKTSFEFYEYLKLKNPKTDIMLMNGDDNLYTRKTIIDKIKDKTRKEKLILISTQVIEAGVDVDFDAGFKDISILDAEEQFMGRVNRSCAKKGEDCPVFFFNLDKVSDIYRNDKRAEKFVSLENEDIQRLLKDKNFSEYYKKILENLEKQSTKNINDSYADYKRNFSFLNFKYICDRLKLLKEENCYTVFLNRTLDVNGEKLVGEEVWQEYLELLQNRDLPYAEKKIRISELTANKFNHFVYKVRSLGNHSFNDNIGDIFYFRNGEDFFTENGKFDRGLFGGKT